MSRLEAALRRASTGLMAVPPADLPPSHEDVSPEHDFGTEGRPDDVRTGRNGNGRDPSAGGQSIHHDDPPLLRFGRRFAEKVVVSPATPSAVRENYRRLAATLHHAQAENGLKTLMVTSAVPEEGKTLTATNLALTLSESYQRRVLLIDADLRRPALAEVFQIPNVFGLHEALTSAQERQVSVIQVSRQLAVLTAGSPNPDPMSSLTSERMQRLLAEAAAGFDWVVIDTPPVGVLTDAKLLSAMVDGALLVVRAGSTSADLVQRAIDAVGRARIVGVVLNRALSSAGGAYPDYSQYYSGSRGANGAGEP
jgi:capsular exopolysaccharide synthesis family protein